MSEQSFNVIAGGDIQLIEGRQNAVKLAKELSGDSHTQVTVERDDGMELMQFADGSLYSLVCETRGRRKPTIAEQRRTREEGEAGEAAKAADAPAADAPAAAAPAEAAPAEAAPAEAALAEAAPAEAAPAEAAPAEAASEEAASEEAAPAEAASEEAAAEPAAT